MAILSGNHVFKSSIINGSDSGPVFLSKINLGRTHWLLMFLMLITHTLWSWKLLSLLQTNFKMNSLKADISIMYPMKICYKHQDTTSRLAWNTKGNNTGSQKGCAIKWKAHSGVTYIWLTHYQRNMTSINKIWWWVTCLYPALAPGSDWLWASGLPLCCHAWLVMKLMTINTWRDDSTSWRKEETKHWHYLGQHVHLMYLTKSH